MGGQGLYWGWKVVGNQWSLTVILDCVVVVSLATIFLVFPHSLGLTGGEQMLVVDIGEFYF